jgi:hypothetical protein
MTPNIISTRTELQSTEVDLKTCFDAPGCLTARLENERLVKVKLPFGQNNCTRKINLRESEQIPFDCRDYQLNRPKNGMPAFFNLMVEVSQ